MIPITGTIHNIYYFKFVEIKDEEGRTEPFSNKIRNRKICMHNTYEILSYMYRCIKYFTADLVAETILLFIVVCPKNEKRYYLLL